MAASSPIPSTNDNDNIGINAGAAMDTPKQNLRGLNKPKCSKCGNVARSRCPYHSCKSCCAKAQNPCPIHVLKSNVTFPDQPPSSSSPLFGQQSTDASPTGASPRLSSLRQLSSTNFSRFNGAQAPIRARKPLSRKEAAIINAWRFVKLKEYHERGIEAENEAFDRYMQNVSLLEEAFFVNSSLDGLTPDGQSALEPTSSDENAAQKMVSGIKAKLKSNSQRADSCRHRIRDLIDLGLKKLQIWGFDDEVGSASLDDPDGQKDLKRPKKAGKWRDERTLAVSDLNDKLNKARNEDDLKSCLEMKLQLFNQNDVAHPLDCGKDSVCEESKDIRVSGEQIAGDNSIPRRESDTKASSYSVPRLYSTVQVNQEILSTIDVEFSSLDQIEDL